MPPRRKIEGRFAPIRIGLRAHMPKLAQNPAATHLYLWCHLSTERTGPEPGVVSMNATALADECGWSRGNVNRALRFLTVNPRRDKPYLVRLNANQRGATQRYYIRNFEGNDPTEDAPEVVPPTVQLGGSSCTTSGTTLDPSCTAHGTTERSVSCTASCTADGTTCPEVVPPHVPSAVQLYPYRTRAETTRESKKTREGISMDETGPKNGTDNQAEYAPRITHVFDTIRELEQHLKFVTFAGLPKELLADAIRRALETPESYGLGLREPDEDTPDADDWRDPFAEVG